MPRRACSRKPPRPAASSQSARSLRPRPICSKFLFYGAVCTAAQPARAFLWRLSTTPFCLLTRSRVAKPCPRLAVANVPN